MLFFSILCNFFLQTLAFAQEDGITSTLETFNRLNSGDKSLILSTMGVPDASAFSLTKLAAYFIFGGVGFIAFMYGKKNSSFKPMVVGLLLMAYPYFISSTLWLYAVGIALCTALYFWRD